MTRRPIAPIAAAAMWAAAGAAQALPNAIIGPVVQADSPLDGLDLTGDLLAEALWTGDAALPGEWRTEGRVATAEISHLLARPVVFGRKVVLLRATRRGGRLEALEATFADAGSFFGYFDDPLPDGLGARDRHRLMVERSAARQAEFSKLYRDTLEALTDHLAALGDDRRPRDGRIGRTRHLRAEPLEFRYRDLLLQLLAADQRLVRVAVRRASEAPGSWLDRSLEELSDSQRLERLAGTVRTRDDGTVAIESLQPIPQGYQPYCGLNTLAMVARHFGLHLDEDWLAAAAGFQNIGSASGSNLPRVYQAVASEAGLALDRSTGFDAAGARRALGAGLPVVVWRRFSSQRDQLHTRFASRLARDPSATLPDPGDPAERASWPGPDAPLHASVLVGFHDRRDEFLFLESWTGRDTPRRMRSHELAATAYLSFVFRP